MSLKCPFNKDCHYAHKEEEINPGYQPNLEFLEDITVYDPTINQLDGSLDDMPLNAASASTSRVAYWLLQAPDLRSLAIAQRRRVWAMNSSKAAEINASYRSCKDVIIFFCVRPLRGIYGLARLEGPVPSFNSQADPITPEFPIKWLRSLRLPLRTVAQVKQGNSGMFIGRSSVDGRFESKVGFDMLLTAYRKPAWNWMLEIEKAEANIRIINDAGPGSSLHNEYYPAQGSNPYLQLPADTLFAPEWVDRARMIPNDKGIIVNPKSLLGGIGGKPNALEVASSFYMGNLPGFIFCGTPQIIQEMFERQIFGLPIEMQDVVIHPNVPLFIFDTMAQVMLGIFSAESAITMNMEPTAFVQWMGVGQNGGSPLPLQLRFRNSLEAPPIPIHDAELQTALHGNMAMGKIGVLETRTIANLFARRSPSFQAQMASRIRESGAAGQGFVGSYKPPFKNVETVPIAIHGSLFEIKKKVLGQNASNIIAIIDELASKQTCRIR